MNLDGKVFRVVRNDGPGADVTTQTVFRFHQDGATFCAEYEGGGVQVGRMVGVIEGNLLRHAYVQVNTRGDLKSGRSTDEVVTSDTGLLRLIDRWRWEDGSGEGMCIFEEVP